MKKIITSTAQLLTLVSALSLTGCSASKDYFPKEELCSDDVNAENLSYFKEVFMGINDFMYEDYAIAINGHGMNYTVKLYGLDATGKTVDSFDVKGDIADDIFSAIIADSYRSVGYEYDFVLEENDNVNTLLGERRLDPLVLEQQESNILSNYRDFLIEAGYPEELFDYDEETDTLYYGKFVLEGEFKRDVVSIIYGGKFYPSYTYEFTHSKGVISTKKVDVKY